MKKIFFLFISLFFSCSFCFAQTESSRLKNFLSELKKNEWTFDEIKTKYLFLGKKENHRPTTKEEYEWLDDFYSKSLSLLSEELRNKNVTINDIYFIRYDHAEEALKTMILDKETEKNVYIATNNKDFKHYFLLKDRKISAWLTIKDGRVFLGYDL